MRATYAQRHAVAARVGVGVAPAERVAEARDWRVADAADPLDAADGESQRAVGVGHLRAALQAVRRP